MLKTHGCASGVAIIYLSRNNALFSQVFGTQDVATDRINALMTCRDSMFADISMVNNNGLLEL